MILATLLVLAGTGGFYWHFSRSILKIQVEAANSRRVAEQIAAEGRRRILGLEPRPYPTRARPGPLLPASMLVGGLALLILALWPRATPSPALYEVQTNIPPAREEHDLDAQTTTVGANLFVRDEPFLSGFIKDRLPPGSPIRVECWAPGEAVITDGIEFTYWLRISFPTEGWVSGAYVELHDEEFECDT